MPTVTYKVTLTQEERLAIWAAEDNAERMGNNPRIRSPSLSASARYCRTGCHAGLGPFSSHNHRRKQIYKKADAKNKGQFLIFYPLISTYRKPENALFCFRKPLIELERSKILIHFLSTYSRYQEES